MTIKELHINVEQSLQSLTSFTDRDLDPEEIDIALNKCILRQIDNILEKSNDEGFEGTSANLNKLKNLITINSLDYLEVSNSSTLVYSLPVDYYREIRGQVFFSEEKKCRDFNSGVLKTKPYKGILRILEQKEVDDSTNDTLRETTKDSIISSLIQKNLYIYSQGKFVKDDISKIELTYIKEPPKIKLSEDTEDEEYLMPDDFMEDLADITALHISKVIEADKKAQLLTSENIK